MPDCILDAVIERARIEDASQSLPVGTLLVPRLPVYAVVAPCATWNNDDLVARAEVIFSECVIKAAASKRHEAKREADCRHQPCAHSHDASWHPRSDNCATVTSNTRPTIAAIRASYPPRFGHSGQRLIMLADVADRPHAKML
jgi:hypothetical protein